MLRHIAKLDAMDTDAGADLLGLRFPNRIGLAAGFDKSARHLDELGQLGFGFIEVGTVTPRPQPGHPPPNLFRLVEDEALINRMGFNNDGVDAVVRRLERRRYRGICGVNIGKNADTPLAQSSRDYVTCLRAVYAAADYVTVNISSPNTPGLRQLQDSDALRHLLMELAAAREELAGRHRKRVPMLVKLAPDLDATSLEAIGPLLREFAVDGVVATNTTTTRPASLRSRHAAEAGGLSGQPLHSISIDVIRALRAQMGDNYPIIGVGGIASAEGGRSTFEAGADLLQIYTGLIYQGPGLVSDLVRQISQLAEHSGAQPGSAARTPASRTRTDTQRRLRITDCS
jgi:dihydroorotate dehydrogenase